MSVCPRNDPRDPAGHLRLDREDPDELLGAVDRLRRESIFPIIEGYKETASVGVAAFAMFFVVRCG